MKTHTLLFVLGLTLVAASAQAASQTTYGTGNQALPWLRLDNNARSSAQAGLGSAYLGDINNLTVNPASLGGLKGQQAALMHNQGAAGSMTEHLAYGLGLDGYGLGLSIDYVSFGSVDSYRYDSGSGLLVKGSAVNPSAYCMALGYGQVFGDWAAGINVKLAGEDLGGLAQGGFATDLGLRWQASPQLAVALSGQNVGPPINGSSLPTALRASLLSRFELVAPEASIEAKVPTGSKMSKNSKKLRAESFQPVVKPGQDLNLGLELAAPLADTRAILAGLGLEYSYAGQYALRAGYKLGGEASPSGPTAGAGLKFGLMRLDYAWESVASLGSSHRVSALVEF